MADTINILSTFTGSGFHDTAVVLALEALGYPVRAVGYVEREAGAAATLMARMVHKTLERAPVWIDCISRLDARPLRGHVDILIGSPPCQPYSSAGKRLGNADQRSHGDGEGPLVHLARIIEESDPALVWFENVPEWFTGGHFRSFGERLCDLGFDFAEPVFATSAWLGNVHERERGFILGYTERGRAWARAAREQGRAGIRRDRLADAGVELAERPGGGREELREPSRCDGQPSRSGGAVGDADRLHQGRRQDAERGAERGATARGPGGELADHDGGRLQADTIEPGSKGPGLRYHTQRGGADLGNAGGAGREGAERRGPHGEPRPAARGPVGESGGPPLCPPHRNDYRRWAELVAGGLDPTLMPAVERGIPVLVDEMAPSSSDLLRIGGNGVDPLVVAYAFLRSWRAVVD